MAAAFMAMNSVFGPLFNVAAAEAADPEATADRVKSLRDQLIIDVQTHFVYPDYPSRSILRLRELAKRWNPQLHEAGRMERLHGGHAFRESKWPWRLDDEDRVYPAYEKMVKAGITTICRRNLDLPPLGPPTVS